MVVSKFRHFLFACVFLKRNVKAVGPSYQGPVPGVEHWMIIIIGHGNYIQAYYSCIYTILLFTRFHNIVLVSIYTIILLISVGVRILQVAIIARSSREMYLTVRII